MAGLALPPPAQPDDYEGYDEDAEGDEYPYDEDEEDMDVDAHAEALAQQMRDQLRAQLGQAYGAQPQSNSQASPSLVPATSSEPPSIASAIQAVLKYVEEDSRIQSLLSNTTVSAGGPSVYALLTGAKASGVVDATHSMALSDALVKLADGDALDTLPATGKRKRENGDANGKD